MRVLSSRENNRSLKRDGMGWRTQHIQRHTHTQKSQTHFHLIKGVEDEKRGPSSSKNISHPYTCVCVQPVYLLLASVIISITRPSSTIYLRLVMTLIFGEAKKRNGLKMYCCLSPTSTSRRHSCKSLAWLWTTTTRVKKRKTHSRKWESRAKAFIYNSWRGVLYRGNQILERVGPE